MLRVACRCCVTIVHFTAAAAGVSGPPREGKLRVCVGRGKGRLVEGCGRKEGKKKEGRKRLSWWRDVVGRKGGKKEEVRLVE